MGRLRYTTALMEHVIDSKQFGKETIKYIFNTADSFSKSISEPLRGKIMASLFFEPSTRTRFSFESAMLRLGGEVVSAENAGQFSSAAKGETLEDTIRVLQCYADVIVLRHAERGASKRAAAVSRVPVINAGDGAGEHPSQGLLDLYTIRKECGRIDGIRIVFVGDLKNSRTVHSLGYLLGKYKNVHISFVAPKTLQIGADIKAYLAGHKVRYEEKEHWGSVLEEADVIYQTRIQKERFASMREYGRFKGRYILTKKEVLKMKKHSIIMHPLPRVDEISPEVDVFPQAAYFRQVGYGLFVRMALLEFLLNPH